MSTGISMSSVNKIKELADNGDYSLALDILEHQDLSKSLSPQFIRICGEVYYENKRYSEARTALVRAHSMAPAGNKIIYSIIRLYLSMGFWELAEKYYEIYKFNQTSKDAGTHRIEYLIAKAHRKPVNELYGILLAANDMETDEDWDFEMLALHAYIGNREKLASACIEFKANYRNSSRLSMLDSLMDDKDNLERIIYCYPENMKKDDSEDQAEIRSFEKKVLDEDELRIHPKDAKIMIMVEDDAPVSNTMKFKQMWMRSKDKKEKKKADKSADKNQDEAENAKKPKGLFGRMTQKEETLVEQGFEELKNEKLDKEALLEEVLTKNEDEQSESEADVSGNIDSAEEEVGAANQDMVEIKGDSDDDGLKFRADAETLDEDSFVIEEEPEEVVMVDSELFDEVSDEDEEDEEFPAEEETFSPEFDIDSSDEDFDFDAEVHLEVTDDEAGESFEAVIEAEVPEQEDTEEAAKPEADDVEEAAEPEAAETVIIEDAAEPEADDVEEAAEPEETETVIEEVTEPEADNVEETAETVEPESSFDFDKAFDDLDEFAIDDDFDVDVSVEEETVGIDDDLQIEELEEVTGAEVQVEEPEEAIEAETQAEEPEEAIEAETQVEESEEATEAETQAEEPEEAIEAETQAEEPEEAIEAETQAEEPEEVTEAEAQMEEPKKGFTHYYSEKTAHAEFPVFKTSLFPDYNTEQADLYKVGAGRDNSAEELEDEEAKISESLKKEEALMDETDRLLARLGIKLNTEFKSILDFDEDDEVPEETPHQEKKADAPVTNEQTDDGKAGNKPFKLKK